MVAMRDDHSFSVYWKIILGGGNEGLGERKERVF